MAEKFSGRRADALAKAAFSGSQQERTGRDPARLRSAELLDGVLDEILTMERFARSRGIAIPDSVMTELPALLDRLQGAGGQTSGEAPSGLAGPDDDDIDVELPA